MTIISFQEIIELNHILEGNKIPYRLHLKDRCGGQSIQIEAFSGSENNESYSKLQEVVTNYFLKIRLNVQFDESRLFLKLYN